MNPERAVELIFGRLSQGTGYLLTNRHVLTARHVVPSGQDTCTVRRLSNAASSSGTVGWISPDKTMDIAVVELAQPVALASQSIRFGRMPTNDLYPREFACVGFPEAAGTDARVVFGKMTYVPSANSFDLDVASASPKTIAKWAGLSGALIHSRSLAIGIVREVDGRWDRKLTGTPLQSLYESESFRNYCRVQQIVLDEPLELPQITEDQTADIELTALEHVAEHIYLMDRTEPIDEIKAQIDTASTRSKSKAILIPGLSADMHRHLIRRLAENTEIQIRLGRETSADQVIRPLPWPEMKTLRDPRVELLNLLKPLYAAAGLASPTAETLSDTSILRERLNDGAMPRAYWTLLSRQMAFGGHTQLLCDLLKFWESLGEGHPVFLFLCLALDEPPAPKPRLLPWAPVPQAEQNLIEELGAAYERSRDRVISVAQLEKIQSAHVQTWIEELQRRCRSLGRGNLDVLGMALMLRLKEGQGEGEHLAGVGDALRVLVPSIMK